MEFMKTAEGEDLEVYEATEEVAPSGEALDAALRSFEGREVVACGFTGGRLWVRCVKEPPRSCPAGHGTFEGARFCPSCGAELEVG